MYDRFYDIDTQFNKIFWKGAKKYILILGHFLWMFVVILRMETMSKQKFGIKPFTSIWTHVCVYCFQIAMKLILAINPIPRNWL